MRLRLETLTEATESGRLTACTVAILGHRFRQALRARKQAPHAPTHCHWHGRADTCSRDSQGRSPTCSGCSPADLDFRTSYALMRYPQRSMGDDGSPPEKSGGRRSGITLVRCRTLQVRRRVLGPGKLVIFAARRNPNPSMDTASSIVDPLIPRDRRSSYESLEPARYAMAIRLRLCLARIQYDRDAPPR